MNYKAWEKKFDKFYKHNNDWMIGIISEAIMFGRNQKLGEDASFITKKLRSLVAKREKEVRDRVIEFMSHDMTWDNEKQRKAAVKMYIESFDEGTFK